MEISAKMKKGMMRKIEPSPIFEMRRADLRKQVGGIIEKAGNDTEVLAVFLFGSVAQGKARKNSDVDICLVLKQNRYTAFELSQKKMEYLKSFNADIQIFQQLPLYIRKRIIREAKMLFCKDEDELYLVAFRTISEFEDFRHIYYDYLEEVESVR